MAVSEEIEFNPLVSVIIPCYNHGKYLEEAVRSVTSQTYRNWECIIINDGSEDNTEEIAVRLAKTDSRIRCYSKPNGGLSAARNSGLEKISGSYIQFLDADDTIGEMKFEKSVQALTAPGNRQAIVISDFSMYNDVTGQIMPAYCRLAGIDFSFRSLLTGWDEEFTIPIHCAFFPAAYFSSLRFDETLRAKEDWVMWLSVFREFHPPVIYLPEQLALYRGSPNSMSNHSTSMYENTGKAFEIIYSQLKDEAVRDIFFNKVNRFWKKEALHQSREVELMKNARYFRIRKKILAALAVLGLGKKPIHPKPGNN